MENKITTEMIERGIHQGLIVPYLDGDLRARIGEYWFYFGGSEFETTPPEKIPFEILVSEIKIVLDDFASTEDFKDEYLYYYHYLTENLSF